MWYSIQGLVQSPPKISTIDRPSYRNINCAKVVLQSFARPWQYVKDMERFSMVNNTPVPIEYRKPDAVSASFDRIRGNRLCDLVHPGIEVRALLDESR